MAKKGPSAGGGVLDTVSDVVVTLALVNAARRDAAPVEPEPDPAPLARLAPEQSAEPAAGIARLIWRLDRLQRRHPPLAFPIAVAKKFGEDKAGFLAALVAYFGFFSIFPLMLAFMSVLGFLLPDPDDQREFAEAAADQIPVIGGKIQQTAGALDGSVIAIVIPVLVALWSGLRIVDAMQNALNDVWELPRIHQPTLIKKRLRGVVMLGLIGGGLIGSVAASNVAALIDVIPGVGKLAIWAASLAVSILLYVLAFQLLTDVDLPWDDIWPGAVVGGVGWWALQTFGSPLIIRQQEAAGATYGDFATIIALLVFLFLAAQVSILGAEISVVRARRLWPRSLVKGDYTPADIRVFEMLADATRQDASYRVRIEPVEQAPAP